MIEQKSELYRVHNLDVTSWLNENASGSEDYPRDPTSRRSSHFRGTPENVGKASDKQPGTSSREDDFLFLAQENLALSSFKGSLHGTNSFPQDYPATLEMIQCVCVCLAAFYR